VKTCANCGGTEPAEARFCSRCGAPLVGGDVAVEQCEIRLWRGYTRSEFTALAGERTVVSRSRPFRWRKDGAPPHEEPYVTTHAELVRSLEEDGWVRSGQGDDWYALSLTRGLETSEP
jgi:hypothetical protein